MSWHNNIVTITDAQRDVRTTFQGGFAGQLVSSAVWLLLRGDSDVAVAQDRDGSAGCSRILGHPINALGMQVAFVLPFCLPLVFAATAYRQNWFYPALMIVLGSHYLPFIFLYGMWQFGVLAMLLISSGLVIGMYLPSTFSLGGWSTALVLLVFAFVGRGVAHAENKTVRQTIKQHLPLMVNRLRKKQNCSGSPKVEPFIARREHRLDSAVTSCGY